MAQHLLNVRIRPSRVTVLISKDSNEADLHLAFEFFSKIWGGRYCLILAVDPQVCDNLTKFRLGAERPEFVYGIGLNDDHWREGVLQACQPRGYGPLKSDFVRGIKRSHAEDYYLVDHALIHLFQTRETLKRRKRTLRLVSTNASSPYSIYLDALYGVHNQDLNPDYFDLKTTLAEDTTSAMLDLATDIVKEWHMSWIDVTGHELNLRTFNTGPLEPTIVLVDSPVADLTLFWNLRRKSDTPIPAWIIPIPIENATDPIVLQKLKEWLVSFLAFGWKPDYCLVTSQTVTEEKCEHFATLFKGTLTDTLIKEVDYEPAHNHIAVVVPYEYETVWAVDITGRKVTFVPPRPRAFEEIGPNRAWVVDLLKDVKTGRAIKGLQLPASLVAFDLLNGPCPPGFEQTRIPRTGDGVDCINIRCSERKEVVQVYLPSPEEVLEEILHEHGIEPVHDEKRSSYLPAIKRLGGLQLAAGAFKGKSALILKELENGAKTLREIRGACQLGDGTLPGKSYQERNEFMLAAHTDRIKRIGRKRFAQYAKHLSPDLRLASVLEYWADRSVLRREWKIGPCSRCKQSSFVPNLNIQRRISCPSCGNRVSLQETVPLGYTLSKPIRLAIQQGIIPVVLTGRFLENMTHSGFFWLPGVKFKHGKHSGDIDLLACCDGLLVFCECKQLENIPPDAKVWEP